MKIAIVALGLALGLSSCLDPSDEGPNGGARTARDSNNNNNRGNRSGVDKAAPNAGSDRVSRSKEGIGKGNWRH